MTEVTLGPCRLILGDAEQVIQGLPQFDLLATDPPYGLDSWTSTGGNSITAEQAIDIATWDAKPVSADLLDACIAKARLAVVWGGNYFGRLWPCRAPLIWDKSQRGMHFADGEMAWTNFDFGTLRILNYSILNGDTKGKKEHPTQKPVPVMEWSLAQAKIGPDATVLDPFMGSGTTGIACIRTGRSFVGIEKDPKHFATAVDRIKRELSQPMLIPVVPKHEQPQLIE